MLYKKPEKIIYKKMKSNPKGLLFYLYQISYLANSNYKNVQ